MKLYKFKKIVSICDIEVWAENEREALDEALDDAEWDYNVVVIDEDDGFYEQDEV